MGVPNGKEYNALSLRMEAEQKKNWALQKHERTRARTHTQQCVCVCVCLCVRVCVRGD